MNSLKFQITKISIVCLILAALASACGTDNKHGSNTEVATIPDSNRFGEKFDDNNALSMTDFLLKMDGKNEMEQVKVTAKIAEVCQEMGCWMNLDKGDGTVMIVKMKDHEFFLPKDAAGKTAVVYGNAKRDSISVDELKHFAADAGKPESEIEKITQSKYEVSFIAAGVIIK
jgi:hypothetical protein